MANGDIASSVGWTTYSSAQQRSLGYDNDNYALDRAAEQYVTLRDTVLPAINQPIFAAKRGTTIYNVVGGSWTAVTGSPFATPILNDGFTSWSGGILTIAKGGVYRVSAHVQFTDANYNRTAVEIVKNTSSAGTNNTLARNVTGGGLSVDASNLVRLVPGDVLRLVVYQRETGGASHGIDLEAADLSFTVEWVRA
ncbi:hypothetical protein [Curtobacterium poinsettiae]|uniref:hypothetical protein n=1 Tax=Curtobacterium TaxID=2034 RepID=UPI00217E2CDC|nr:hypothetical protein [Curtobacterium flaccumfaciens]MCS6563427.1 hypothetical protein [Curtobacterium flaccumfaciens pv. poinsettiae]UXN30311.1 hypothetical protein N8D75_08780 [Curtobacterium flaccumfaciens]